MSLIEAAQHAPLASEEKSLDKLEIEMEEKEHMIKEPNPEVKAEDKTEAVESAKDSDDPAIAPAPAQAQDTQTETKGKKGTDEKTPKKPKINIKIPQILRKRSNKERPSDKIAEEKNDVEPVKKVDEEKGGEKDKESKEIEAAIIPTSDAVEDKKEEPSKDPEAPAESSFLAAFTTPKWANFRRVFHFNRSTPAPMAMCEVDSKCEDIKAVTLDIPPTPQAVENGEKALIEAKDEAATETQAGRNFSTSAAAAGNMLIAPIVKLFRSRRTPKRTEGKDIDLDVESGVATELLDKNSKATEEKDVGKTGSGKKEGKDGADGKAESKMEEATGDGSDKMKNGDGDKKSPLSKPQIWRQRITQLPKFSKWIIGVASLIILLSIVIIIAVIRACQVIDIRPLIVNGKYINSLTSCGPIQGIIEDDGYVFRGIPYAVPPVGELRWRPAKTHQKIDHCWNGTYLAHNYSTACWQFYRNGSYDGSEDCLYLDVYTPKVYYDTPVPIVVLIGGETLNGGQSSTLRPSAKLAREKNVMFVSVSIRRSVLGFLSLDILSRSTYPMSSGNYGLSDLLAALQWVRYNAEHFGGDKNSVTLLGHQSGSTLATALLTSHQSKGLFHRIWVSGGSPLTTLLSIQDAEKQNQKFLSEVGCSSIECLYNKSPEELLESVPYDWRSFHQDLPTKNEDLARHHWLSKDGIILREPVNKILIINEIPFVAGATSEVDASPEMFSYLDWNDTSKFSSYLESKFNSFGPSLSREVSDRYFRPESTPWQQFAALLSDLRTICPLFYSTTAFSNELENVRVNFYVATQRRQTPLGFVADSSADLAAILGVYYPETKEEIKFVQNMEKLFYNFVNEGQLTEREADDVSKSIFIVDENIQRMFTYPNCDFWKSMSNYSRID